MSYDRDGNQIPPQLQVNIVPAAPGYNLLTPYYRDDKVESVWRRPIIAWRITTEIHIGLDGYSVARDSAEVCPIVPDGIETYFGWAVELPSGRIDRDDRSYANEAELLAVWQQEECEAKDEAEIIARNPQDYNQPTRGQ